MSRKRINRKLLIVATTLAIVCVVGLNTKDVFNSYSEDAKLNISNQIEQSDNRILKGILENRKYNFIPRGTLRVSIKKTEVIDFVADFTFSTNNQYKESKRARLIFIERMFSH